MARRLNGHSGTLGVDRRLKALAQKEKWSGEDAAAIVKAWEASGMSLAAFARQLGVGAQRIRWWRDGVGKRPAGLRKKGSARRKRATGLVPVEIRPAAIEAANSGGAAMKSFVEVELSGGRRVRFGAGSEPAAVVQVVRELEALGC